MSSSEQSGAGVGLPEQNQDGEMESTRGEREESDSGDAVENGDSTIGYEKLEVEENGERVEAANDGVKQPEVSFGTERDVEDLNDLDAVERDSSFADEMEEQPILNQQQRHVILEDSPPPMRKPYLSVSPSTRTGYEDLDQPMEDNPPPSAYETVEGNVSSSSSESDEEGEGGGFYGSAGYMLLPQDPEQQELETDSTEVQPYWLAEQDEEREGEGEGGESVQDSVPASTIEETQVSAIRQAMVNFALPSSSVPQWAKVVPEDVWKAKLIGGLKKKQEDPSSKDQ